MFPNTHNLSSRGSSTFGGDDVSPILGAELLMNSTSNNNRSSCPSIASSLSEEPVEFKVQKEYPPIDTFQASLSGPLPPPPPPPMFSSAVSSAGDDVRHEVYSGIERSNSHEELLNMKRELLYKFDRLEKKGIRLPRKFTLSSNIDDMRQEYDRITRDREMDNSVVLQRRMMMTIVSGIEFLNNRYDPFDLKLNGWSESVNDGISDYDEIFEELHEKYKGKTPMPPEIKLMMMLGGSAFMFHLTNTMFKSIGVPDAKRVFQENPDLARKFASATAQTMAQDAQPSDPLASGMAGLFQNMFASPPPAAAAPTGKMRGPPPSAPGADLESIFSMAERDADKKGGDEEDLSAMIEIFSDKASDISEASSDATKMPDAASVLVATTLNKVSGRGGGRRGGRGRPPANAGRSLNLG